MTNNKKKIKISDFGIATQTENNLSGKRTLVGTPWFMAPEVINEEAYSNKVSFIWKFSFGLIFFKGRHLVIWLLLLSYHVWEKALSVLNCNTGNFS